MTNPSDYQNNTSPFCPLWAQQCYRSAILNQYSYSLDWLTDQVIGRITNNENNNKQNYLQLKFASKGFTICTVYNTPDINLYAIKHPIKLKMGETEEKFLS